MELSKMTFTDLFKCMKCSTTISTRKILQVVKMELSKMTFTDLFKCMECSTTISTGKILQCINGHIFCERCFGTLNNCQVCGEVPLTIPCRAIESIRQLLTDSVLQFTSAQPTTDDSIETELDVAVKMELSKMTFTDLFKCMKCSTTISTGKILQCINGLIFCERCSGTLNNCQVCVELPPTIPCHAIESLQELLNDSVLQFTSAQPATDDSTVTELDMVKGNGNLIKEITALLKCPVCLSHMSSKIFQCIGGHQLCDDSSSFLAKGNCGICKKPFGDSRIRCARLEKLNEIDILMCPNVGCHTELSLFQRVHHLDCCNFRAFPCPFVALSQCSSHLGSAEMEDHLVNAHGAVYSKEVIPQTACPEDGVPVFLVYVQFFGDECEAKMYFCSPRIIKEAGEDHSTESFKSILWTGLPYDITSKVFVEADYPRIDGLMFNLNMAQAFDQNLNFLADLYSLKLQFGIRCSGS